MERRRFLKRLGAGLSAPAVWPALGALAGPIGELAQDLKATKDPAAFWGRVRKEYLLNPGIVHLNTGSVGSTPRPVLEMVASMMYQIEGDPVPNVFGTLGGRMEEVRAKAAEFLGATLDEVTLTTNTTEGMNAVATSLPLKRGDEVLTTNHEHPGGMVCWDYLAKRLGIKIVVIPIPAPVRDKAQVLQLVKDHITSKTRVCSFSHVETITGLVMPLAEIAKITRPKGILLVCDGAQAPGMLKVDVKALGVDTYASSSHKWLQAPKGSGLLYIRKEAQEKVAPVMLSSGFGSYTASNGTQDVARVLGHGVAIDLHNAIGRDRVEARCRELSRYVRRRLGALSSLKILTPAQDELSGGIVTVMLEKGKNGEIYNRLHEEHGIVVKQVPMPDLNALRISTHINNNEEDVDLLAERLGALLKG